MEKKIKNFDENLQDLIKFCEREGRLPRTSLEKEEARLGSFVKRHKTDSRIIEVKERFSKNKSFEENLQDLIEFCKRENRLPHDRYGGKEDSRLKAFIQRYKKDPRIIEIKKYYCKQNHSERGCSNFEENLQDLIRFCEREGRLPDPSYGGEGGRLNGFTQRYKDNLRIIEIKEKYRRKVKNFDENLQELIEFCKKENRLPHSGCGKEEDSRLGGFVYNHRNDPRIIAIKKKYSKRGA